MTPKNGMAYNTSKVDYQPLKSEVMIMHVMGHEHMGKSWGILCISSNNKPVFQGDRNGEYVFSEIELNNIFEFQKWIETPAKYITFIDKYQ